MSHYLTNTKRYSHALKHYIVYTTNVPNIGTVLQVTILHQLIFVPMPLLPHSLAVLALLSLSPVPSPVPSTVHALPPPPLLSALSLVLSTTPRLSPSTMPMLPLSLPLSLHRRPPPGCVCFRQIEHMPATNS